MKIYPIMYNNYTQLQPKPCNNRSSFGNGFDKPLSQKALDILGQNITDIAVCSELNEVNSYYPYMLELQKTSYPKSKSVEMFKLKNETLYNFLKDKVSEPYELYNYEGIGIAIGDKEGDIENWDKAYETIVCLVPKNDVGDYIYTIIAARIVAGKF